MITYQANEEPSDGEGTLRHHNAKARATFRIQSADLFNGWAAVQEFFFPRTETATVDIGWHEAAWLLTMTYELQQPGEFATISWDGRFTIDQDSKLDGEGSGIILIHSDSVGCAGPGGETTAYDSEVEFSFDIGGRSRPRVSGTGNEFVLEIEGTDHNAATTLSNSECEIDDENLFWGIAIPLWRFASKRSTLSDPRRNQIAAEHPPAVIVLRRLTDDPDVRKMKGGRFGPAFGPEP